MPATFNGDLSSWDVSYVITGICAECLKSCKQILNASIFTWDVSGEATTKWDDNVVNFNQDLSNWDVSSVTTAKHMFYGSSSLQSRFNQLGCFH